VKPVKPLVDVVDVRSARGLVALDVLSSSSRRVTVSMQPFFLKRCAILAMLHRFWFLHTHKLDPVVANRCRTRVMPVFPQRYQAH
jgi:hypothetical protein